MLDFIGDLPTAINLMMCQELKMKNFQKFNIIISCRVTDIITANATTAPGIEYPKEI